MGRIQRKNFSDPDELREPPLSRLELTRVGSFTVGRGILEPGWRWSTHLGPIMGTPSCPIHHTQMILSGQFAIRMDDGEEMVLQPGDIADIPAGHEAWVVGDEPAVMIDVAGNIDAIGVPAEHDRFVTTLLLTDIVDSTRRANSLGDLGWKQVLADHNRLVRDAFVRFRGNEVNTTGDGFLATFSSAVAALRCANLIRTALAGIGLEVRIGIHTGEIEHVGTDIRGIAVNAAARIMALAGASQVLVSSATRALADGSGLEFRDEGSHAIKGFDRPVEVFELVT